MTTIHENLSLQVNGITDTFTTINDISDGVVIDLNGQIVNVLDITILSPTSFKLDFIPKLTDTLSAFITPDQFNITYQVDGIASIFQKHPSDLGTGNFVAILNGQLQAQYTTTIDDNTFSLSFVPQIGDELEYFRVIEVENNQVSINYPVFGIINKFSLNGKIELKKINGAIHFDQINGKVLEKNTINGVVFIANTVKGEIKK